jgi:DNA polymerase/3'-5' exonuclease PolX
LVQALKKDKYLKDDLAMGSHKYLGICKLKYQRHFRRIDILYATKKVWPFSILYFTGSAEFNIRLRNIALTKGLTLNEYGMKYIKGEKKGEDLENLENLFKEEQDIFEYFDLQYITPEKRVPAINLDNYKK